MEVDGESSAQIWSPATTLLIPVGRRRNSRASPIINPEALILAIPILVLLVIFLVLPPFLSYANHQILKPGWVQKGWDFVNIFLVLIAVFCGVLAKRNDDNSSSLDANGEENSDDNIRKTIASSKWLDFPDKSEYDKMTSSRSYPDLRQESLWVFESNGFKCSDDFEVNFHRQPEKLYHRERRSREVETEAVAEPVRRRRSVHRGINDGEKNENKSPPPPPAAPSLLLPLPPPETEFRPVVEGIQREKGGATKEFASAIASLQYGTQGQRKKKVKARDIFEIAREDSLPLSAQVPQSTPPPPPPPPPSKGLQGLLKKSSKSKRVHSVPTTAEPPPPPPPPPPNSIFANIFKTGNKSKRSQLSSSSSSSSQPPPPPPPPPYSIFNNIFSSGNKSKRCQIPSASSHPPPPPPTSSILTPSFENLTKNRRFKNSDTPTPPLPPPVLRPADTRKPPKPPNPNTCSHYETAIIVPPPPPPPPFRTPEINFVAKGDFARNRSTNSSAELKDADVKPTESDGGHSIRPSVSCPSPDVNTKADTFISRLRDGWRLEKLNSINERHNSVSTL